MNMPTRVVVTFLPAVLSALTIGVGPPLAIPPPLLLPGPVTHPPGRVYV